MLLKSEEIINTVKPKDVFGQLRTFATNSACIDSRNAVSGAIFFAFKGEFSDGANFIQHAMRNGATCIITDRIPEELEQKISYSPVCVLLVDDVLSAMHKLAILVRSKITAKVICVTGSIGKTTTKEMIGEVLSNFFSVSTSAGNKNNHIGMPLSLLNADPMSNIIVLEIGMNHVGEIRLLTQIAKPDIAIITTVAPAHVGNFESVQQIAEAKAEIFEGMKPEGIAILNQDNEHFPFLVAAAKKCGVKTIVGLGLKEKSPIYIDDYRVEFNKSTFKLICKTSTGVEETKCSVATISYHISYNTIFMFALAKLLRLDLEEVKKHVAKFKGVQGRGNIETISSAGKKITIINDSYNASPESMKSGIQILMALSDQNPDSRIVCVLGDMLELGEFSQKYHEETADHILQHPRITKVFAVGKEMKHLYNKLPKEMQAGIFETSEVAKRPVRDALLDGDIVLFKGSRSLKLELIIEKLF
ncbi:UDP-N-acetylmuramoyl-tripeptide--D-alanyl-D-alanine ligase [Candidatus Deianiraea vastatrix]|uniref:UDP-N-acetylmuramoyl-tripeptide--D-alanyl-D-alanine ligase n=1 Tax=Candidatus Deianiraea vastatrix TaxID=2163644 RepID=A0A5B8XDJ0_9RICK|nr:UDP-N-acetylmuramoyl-tripeptide--D-alanyl-D-alanine ligase [Candidatus Deianiraea vastatrix]QED23388.1 UDP-N-acetylmuramoyl-tripeptide--D-alanyl-D-alanine ligase [Candidatus Deianiraea vastatrix]